MSDSNTVHVDLCCPNCGVDLDDSDWSDEQTRALVHAIAPELRRRNQILSERRNEIQRELDRLSEMVDRAEARIEDVEKFQEFLTAAGRTERPTEPDQYNPFTKPPAANEPENTQ